MTTRRSALLEAPALSIQQPWADWIVSGRKTIEIRTWATGYRGPIWVHAGQKPAGRVEGQPAVATERCGGLIGLVELEAVVPFDQERWELWRETHLDPGSFPGGSFAWILGKHARLNNIAPLRGQLKLFRVAPELIEEILAENPQLCRTDVDRDSLEEIG
jgi:hypothetical protein